MAVIKILSRSQPSYKSLLNYIIKGGNDPKEIITQNLRSNDVNGWTKEFIENELLRKHARSNQVYLTHEIISFSNEELPDKFTQETAQQLAQEYFRLRGADGVMLGAWHRDKDHIHLHVATSSLKYRTGISFRLSKTALQELKISFQRFHTREMGLTQSTCEHGKGKTYLKDGEWHALNKAWRNIKKDEISDIIRNCLALAGSKKQFYDLLRDQNLHYYERNGVPTGIEVDNMKFRFSRLNINTPKLAALPDEDKEERNMLNEILTLRDSRSEADQQNYTKVR